MIYLILFFITSILFYAAQQLKDTSKVAFYVLSYLAIFLLALVAGCRDNTIGYDIRVYGEYTFNSASQSTSPLTDAFKDEWVEPFFYILNYIASLFGGLGTALFLIMLVQTLFAFYGMKFYMDRAPLWMLMLSYNILLYATTLSLMRQGIAITFLIFSYQYVEKRKFSKLLLMAILGFFWHKSCAIAFVILFGIYFIYGRSEKAQKKLLFITISSCILTFGSLSIVLQSIIDILPIMSRYSAYADSAGTKGSGFRPDLNNTHIVLQLLIIGLALYLYLNKISTQRQFYILVIIILMNLSSQFLGLYTRFATRFAYYFLIVEIPLLFEMLNSDKIRKSTQVVLSNFVLLCLCFMFYWIVLRPGLTCYPYILRSYNITFY